MDIDSLNDVVDRGHDEIGKYRLTVTLTPENILKEGYVIPVLTWNSISYGKDELEKVPNDKRGIYAFAISWNNDVLPPHGYVLYIGIAGRRSDRSLRERYSDYLKPSHVKKRFNIARMIRDWNKVLRFYFAPVDDNISSDDLIALEKQLNTALIPPFSLGDLEADTKKMRDAFK